MTIKPTIQLTSADTEPFVLTVWPSIPGVTTNPVVQIDWDKPRSTRTAAVEFRKEDAAALATAILQAAEQSK